jgi:hypothetical protein
MSRKPKKSGEQIEVRIRAKMDIRHEMDYIIGRARQGEARFVSLGPLANRGGPTRGPGHPTDDTWAIAWDRQFRIEDGMFFSTDQAGQLTSFEDYPVASILGAIQRAMSQQPPR